MKPSRPPRYRLQHSFSLLEILVVLAVLALLFAIVTPRIGKIPQRLAVEQLLSTVRHAFGDASLRARAKSTTVRLLLENEGRLLRIEETGHQSSAPRQTPLADDPEATGRSTNPVLGKLEQYKLPGSVQWRLDSFDDPDSLPVFYFYPDGEATGQTLEFKIGSRRFSLDVDRLSGRPLIADLPD